MDSKNWRRILRAMSLLTQLGLMMIVNIGVGFGLGYWLDNLFGRGLLFKVMGLLLGIGAGFYSAYKLIIKVMNDNDK